VVYKLIHTTYAVDAVDGVDGVDVVVDCGMYVLPAELHWWVEKSL
jgi:hypothetical protein